MPLTLKIGSALEFCFHEDVRKFYLVMPWKILKADTSLKGWGGVLENHSVQETWLLEVQRLLITILLLQESWLVLQHWSACLQSVVKTMSRL